MGTYSYRPAELRSRLDGIKPHLTPDELTRITQVINDYESARESAFSELLGIAGNTSNDFKQSDFNNSLNTGSVRLAQTLGTMLDGLQNPSVDAILFRTQAACEDAVFMRTMAARDFGDARDAMVRFKLRMLQMMDTLRETWNTTADADKRIDDIEKKAAEDMNQALKDAISDGTASYAKAGQLAYDAVDKLKSVPTFCTNVTVACLKALANSMQSGWQAAFGDQLAPPKTWDDYADKVPEMSDPGKLLFEFCKNQGFQPKEVANLAPYLARNPGMVATDKIDDAIKSLSDSVLGPDAGAGISLLIKMLGDCTKFSYGLLGPYVTARRSYLDQLPAEGTILLCFSQSRKMTDDFIQNNGIDVANKYIEATMDDLDHWVSSQSTDALKNDAHVFSQLLWLNFERRIDDLQSIFAQFTSAYKGKFLGPVDTSTQNALVDLDNWYSRRDGLIGLGLDQRLKDWRTQIMTIEPNFESAFSQLQGQLASLPIDFQDAVRKRINDCYSDLKTKIAALRQQATDAIDQSGRAANADDIQKTFNRDDLVRTLNS